MKNLILSICTKETTVVVKRLFDLLSNCFTDFRTGFLRETFFENLGIYTPPETINIGTELKLKKAKNKYCKELTNCDASLQYVPIKKTLKTFLEFPGNFNMINNYLQELWLESPRILTNFVHGKVWKKISEKYKGKLVILLEGYYDDFQADNVLGSNITHNKLGGVYFSIPVLPPECRSKLSNIFVTMLFKSVDKFDFGNKKIFRPLIDDLKKLQKDGLNITVNREQRKVYFVLAALLGDNLSLHDLLGFVTSFTANHPCRFCKSHIDDIRTESNIVWLRS